MGLERVLERVGEGTLTLQKVQFYQNENKVVPVIACAGYLSARKRERVRRELQAYAPEFRVDAAFVCKDLGLALRDPAEALAFVGDVWGELLPQATPFLLGARCRWEGERLCITLPAAATETIYSPASLERLRAALGEWGFTAPIEVETSEELKPQVNGERLGAKPARPADEGGAVKKRAPAGKKSATANAPAQPKTVLYGKQVKRAETIAMDAVREDSGRILVAGWPFNVSARPARNGAGKAMLLCNVTDYTNTLPFKLFLEPGEAEKLASALEEISRAGDHLLVRGDCYLDQYTHELCLQPLDINRLCPEKRTDDSPVKRVELHLHTQLSAMDGVTRVQDAISTAAKWGHKAVAVTDHGVVQAFPEAAKAAAKAGVKLLYGVEGYLIPDCKFLSIREVEPIGVAVSAKVDRLGRAYLTEVAAHRPGGEAFHAYLDGRQGATEAKEAVSGLLAFLGAGILVCHGTEHTGLLLEKIKRYYPDARPGYIDTRLLGHHLLPKQKELELPALLARYGLPAPAGEDAPEAAQALLALYRAQESDILARGGVRVPVWYELPGQEKGRGRNARHIILIASSQKGLYNLYHLVSLAHLEYFRGVPRIPKSLLELYREGVIIGSACEAGELFRALVAGEDEAELLRLAEWYDFLEIQPIGNNAFMLREGTARDEDHLRDFNRRVVALGEALGKPVVATGDVHFLEPRDARYREILMYSRGFEDAEFQAPLYFKTTGEMLEEFAYLGEEKALEVVVGAPNRIADACRELKPYPDGTYAPVIPGAEEDLKRLATARAHELYGDPLPPVVAARLERELHSIITNGFASLYMMAQQLVAKSLGDGYLVGSRGSVGSSFVAHMAGVTEVNPLPPHYICPQCRHADFEVEHPLSRCGIDLPTASCPNCGHQYDKLGFDIPFEVFLGFHGDKTPDIDLNFSGEYQPVAHQYTEQMFGEGHAFRAGTISAVQDKTVYGYLKKYAEEKNVYISRAEMDRLALGCSGVKRTTGQHPGGIVIVPKDRDILEFTPIQYPADQKEKNTVTTHFDFHALDDRLVKLDILGHDDPTALKMLHDITGVDPRGIPLDDPATMRGFSDNSVLGVDLKALDCDVGALGLPEFGTHFVRGMLKETRPTTMEELVRISGLSHGTDVWLNNAQTLLRDGVATLSQAICTRDDIMNNLIRHEVEPSMAFKIMESVRKGKGLNAEMEAAMRAQGVPEWYIASCNKIKYMFPRAHAAAYVIMSFRIAYYKVHHPLAFYAVYLTVRADAFDIAPAAGGANKVLENIRALRRLGNKAGNLEKDLLIILEIVYEMNLRGIELLPVDLYRSHAERFLIEDGALRPPLVAIAGVGATAARAIAREAKAGAFCSREEFAARTKAHQGIVQALGQAGCLAGMPESNQLCLF